MTNKSWATVLLLILGLGIPLWTQAAPAPNPAADLKQRWFQYQQSLEASRPRIIVETDAGGDPDDEQSLVRLLAYANKFDIEGIIANRPHARDGENLNPERTGLGIVRREVKAYGQVWPDLNRNAPGYPTEKYLLDHTVSGYLESDAAVRLIIAAADAPDPRPIWFQNWGTDRGSDPSNLKRALNLIWRERGPAGYARFKHKFLICGSDRFADHTTRIKPLFRRWVMPIITAEDGSWHMYWSELTRYAGGFNLQRDVLRGHGALGALYPTNTDAPQKEGDAPAFVYLIPTGMNDPLHPEWGSWAGRFGPDPQYAGLTSHYYTGNEADTWHGTTSRANSLRRWAADIQNDMRARMDWCVRPFADCNHPPVPVLDGDESGKILRRETVPGAVVELSAAGSFDPDGNALTYDWIPYPEAGGYPGIFSVADPHAVKTTLVIPQDAAGHDLHVVLRVRDNGSPSLVAYRRIIFHVRPRPYLPPGVTVAWPGKTWATATPASVGVATAALARASAFAGGSGCVVRYGRMIYTWGDPTKREDLASSAKPFYTYFLFKALEFGWITSLDARAVHYQPKLADINPDLDYKDRGITLGELANQTSCYGVSEAPGTAYDYNDWQMALFWDVLFKKIYGATYSTVDARVFHPLLTRPLQCQDHPTMLAFGVADRPGRIAISPRDDARFGLLYLRQGHWKNQQLISAWHVDYLTTHPVARELPRTTDRVAEMIPGQRTMGATVIPDDETDHYGSDSWCWWINGVDKHGHRRYPDLPTDVYCALGYKHGLKGMAVIPSLDLVVSWNNTRFGDMPAKPIPVDVFLHYIVSGVAHRPNDQYRGDRRP